jgi:hypothetical protein
MKISGGRTSTLLRKFSRRKRRGKFVTSQFVVLIKRQRRILLWMKLVVQTPCKWLIRGRKFGKLKGLEQ